MPVAKKSDAKTVAIANKTAIKKATMSRKKTKFAVTKKAKIPKKI